MFNITKRNRVKEIDAEIGALYILANLGSIRWEQYKHESYILNKQKEKAEEDLRPLLWKEGYPYYE